MAELDKIIQIFYPTKPPDTHKTIKANINKLLIDNDKQQKIYTKNVINNAVSRINELTIHVYQFLRLFVLKKYHDNSNIPLITKDFIHQIFKVFLKSSAGPTTRNIQFVDIEQFFDKEYLPLIKKIDKKSVSQDKYNELVEDIKFDGTNLSQIINYQVGEMHTNIINNIQMHFRKYLQKFISRMIIVDVYKFTDNYNSLVEMYKPLFKDKNISDDKKKIFKKTLNEEKHLRSILNKRAYKDAYEIIEYMLNGKDECNPIFKKWVGKYRDSILPSFSLSFEDELKHNPEKFLKHMIHMNLQLEKKEIKQFQFLPLRKSFVPKHITIDTVVLVDLFAFKKDITNKKVNVGLNQNKNEYFNNIDKYKEIIWKTIFNLKHNAFKYNNDYSFDYMISTNGLDVSVLFIHKDELEKKIKKHKNMSNGKEALKEACKDMTIDEKEKYKLDEKDKKKAEDLKNRKLKIIEKDKKKEETRLFNESIKHLSNEEKKVKRAERQTQSSANKQKTSRDPIIIYEEFPYINENLTDKKINCLNEAKKVYVDPGQIRLLMMMDDNNNYLCYSRGQYLQETKRSEYQKRIEKYKDCQKITEIENKLSTVNSKTCNYDKFKEYIQLKLNVYKEVKEEYSAFIFRQYKWYGYINKQRTYDNLLNKIAKVYGKDAVLIMGDWSANGNMKGRVSTPGISLKRKLAEKFKVFNLDEFRTSCLHHKTEEKCDNLMVTSKDGIKRSIHSVLTYKNENKGYGCINRDKNSVNNMKKIVSSYLLNKERPLKYRRDHKLEKGATTKKLGDNLSTSANVTIG